MVSWKYASGVNTADRNMIGAKYGLNSGAFPPRPSMSGERQPRSHMQYIGLAYTLAVNLGYTLFYG